MCIVWAVVRVHQCEGYFSVSRWPCNVHSRWQLTAVTCILLGRSSATFCPSKPFPLIHIYFFWFSECRFWGFSWYALHYNLHPQAQVMPYWVPSLPGILNPFSMGCRILWTCSQLVLYSFEKKNTIFNYCGSSSLVLQHISACKHQIVVPYSAEK